MANWTYTAVGRCCVVWWRVRESTERQDGEDDSDDETQAGSGASAALTTVRERMWRAFENPHTSTPALVFYYVTGHVRVTGGLGKLPHSTVVAEDRLALTDERVCVDMSVSWTTVWRVNSFVSHVGKHGRSILLA